MVITIFTFVAYYVAVSEDGSFTYNDDFIEDNQEGVDMTLPEIKDAILNLQPDGPDNQFLCRNNCPICIESFRDIYLEEQHIVFTDCGHFFCRLCAKRFVEKSK